jgi:hypothetical protein
MLNNYRRELDRKNTNFFSKLINHSKIIRKNEKKIENFDISL